MNILPCKVASYNFNIPGKPVAKQRPRLTRSGKAYDLQGDDKRKIKCLIIKEMADKSFLRRLEGPIMLKMTFYTPIPSSWSKKKRESFLGNPDIRRPDIDNYVKMYLDVMSNLIYRDDSQVTELWCKKIFCDKPRVEIVITKIKETL